MKALMTIAKHGSEAKPDWAAELYDCFRATHQPNSSCTAMSTTLAIVAAWSA